MAGRVQLAEGSSINRPPSFNGESYDYWKIRMRIFIEAQDMDVWQIIETGPHVPQETIEGKVQPKKREDWTSTDKQLVQLDLRAKNILTSALGFDEFYRVSNCKSAKEMWDTLQVTHEGTKEVKRSRLNTLCQEYELFRMKQGESISEMQKRFTHIVNHLQSLGKSYTPDELNLKVLRSLNRQWQPKVTAISEKKSLSTMSLATLFGKLQEHEMELLRLEENEGCVKEKGKSIALKASSRKSEPTSETSSSSDGEINLLAKKFRKFLKKNSQKKNFKPAKKSESSNKSICYECGKPGHFKSECPELKKKQEKKPKKKSRRAYIAWEDNESISSSSSSELEESANICLMAGETEVIDTSDSNSPVSSPSSSSSSSSSHISYDSLHNAFKELLNDSVQIERENNRLKSQIKGLAEENNRLNDEIGKLTSQINFMEEIEIFKPTIRKKPIKKESMLDTLLKSQKSYSNRHGIGYVPKTRNQKKNRKNQSNRTIFVKSRKLPKCNYCMKEGHISTHCFVKIEGIKIGKYKWVVKNSHKTDQHGPSVTCHCP